MKPRKMDWLAMEGEIRAILETIDDGEDALDCIAAVIGWYSGRGYPRQLEDDARWERLCRLYPQYARE